MLVLLLLALGSVEAVKKAPPSALFEAYAMAPYGYYYPYPPYPGYGPPPGQPPYAPPPAQAGAYPVPAGPYGPPPPGFYPPFISQPGQGYYDPRMGMQFSYDQRAPPARPVVQQDQPPVPPPQVEDTVPAQPKRTETPHPYPVVAAKLSQRTVTTPNPLKAALSEALNEATKDIDKANAQAATRLVSFDGLDYSPRNNPPPVSLSQESVPIDDHILNWRELVGLPGSNPMKDPLNPVSDDGVTPLLAGHVNDRLR
jgi:hypothetical protein